MKTHRSIHHTVIPEGYVQPVSGITRTQMFFFTPFINWLKYIKA
jgi:hypothetical protein